MDIDAFGTSWVGSGTLGFFGEGYWYHRPLSGVLSFKNSLFVAKTTTAFPNKGNMALTKNFEPKHLFPDCVVVHPLHGIALNSVGLSGPGVEALLNTGRWQEREGPFQLSFMAIGKTIADQLEEAEHFFKILKPRLREFKSTQVGLQLNVSCPNVGADMSVVEEKAQTQLDILGGLNIPIFVKLNLLTTPKAAQRIGQHPACSGLCVANTTPFGQLFSEDIWKYHFPNGSPLEKRGYGGGGLSGTLNYPKLVQWVRAFRELDKKKYLNAGGGIDRTAKVVEIAKERADSFSFATAAITRPWRVREMAQTSYHAFHRM